MGRDAKEPGREGSDTEGPGREGSGTEGLLPYEKQLAAELIERDSLCILASGLGLQRLLAVFLRLHHYQQASSHTACMLCCRSLWVHVGHLQSALGPISVLPACRQAWCWCLGRIPGSVKCCVLSWHATTQMCLPHMM